MAASCKLLLGAVVAMATPTVGVVCGGAALLATVSCSESDDTVEEFPDWQATNTAYWNSLYTTTQQKIASGDSSWKIIRSYSLEDSIATSPTDNIVVNVVREGTGSGCPLYSDSVRIRDVGRLLPSVSYPDGYVIDTTNPDEVDEASQGVRDASVSGFINGFSTALQHMHIGDTWDVYIPWTLGYGEAGSGSTIPGYSVLCFRISLVAYSRAGNSLPDFKAKRVSWVWE